MSDHVIHRNDPGGPEAAIDCADGGVTATWEVPAGSLLPDHPVLNTGGYVYFTLDSEPTNTITMSEGGGFIDFSGEVIPEGRSLSLGLTTLEPDVVYRAHILLAYEDDGPAWHNDTQFSCSLPAVEITETPVSIEVETLPYTGYGGDGLLLVAALLLVGGISCLQRWFPWD